MATFEKVSEHHKGERITVPFDMLHVSLHPKPPDEIKSSPLVNAAGWVEVNQNSMQHVRNPNICSLGHVSSTPNSKTAAAVRKQAPVVVDNLLHMIGQDGRCGRIRRLCVMPTDDGLRQNHPGGVHLRGKVTPTLQPAGLCDAALQALRPAIVKDPNPLRPAAPPRERPNRR